MDFLASIDTFFFESVTQQLYAFHPNLPMVPDRSTSLIGSWYLSPKQHIVEFIIYNIVFFTALYKLVNAFPNWIMQAQLASIPFNKRGKLAKFVELVASIVILASIVSMIIYKYQRDSLIFLLQPCHIFNFLLVALCLWPEESPVRHALFHVHLYCCWGAVLALAFPDFRDYGMPFEVTFFYIQHIFLVVLPIVWLITGKFAIVSMRGNGFIVTLVAFFAHAIYHSFVLALVGLYTGKNVNYLMSPPTGILEHFGIFYRPVMYIFCFALTVFMRFAFIGGLVKLFNIKSVYLTSNSFQKTPPKSTSEPVVEKQKAA